MTKTSSAAPLMTIHNETGKSLPRLLLRLLWRAATPSERVIMWERIAAPLGSPLRASDALMDLYCYADRSGMELTVGERTFCFGIEPRRLAAAE